ncbi:2-hydroxyacid dehydrogenase [Rhodoflexus caldus]|uniref:2-hydroxyacid dehydrogenase n=1 Tax=Rhodoflexus caldus TaxID=2891236 RepID=UPI002029E81F|nr:2-hydroxyacid dehydrogenase [Rhodoflexus caldus]
MQKRVLIIDTMHESLLPMLEKAGFAPDYLPQITRAEILDIVGHYQVMIVRSKTPIDAELLGKATQLEVLARAGAGTDQVDMAALQACNIALINAPEGNRDAVGEHAMGMLLALMNKLLQADAQVRQKIWQREANRGYELMGKTVGIIGYGHMGQSFAKRLSGFGCRVLAYDKYKSGFSDTYATEASLEQLWAEAEVLSLHVPLTAATRGWINTDFFNRFAHPIWFVNTARGEIVPLASLREALQSGKLRGACLDVLEQEKLDKLTPAQAVDFEWLTQQPNVIFSPHVAGWTYESYERINRVLVDKLVQLTA